MYGTSANAQKGSPVSIARGDDNQVLAVSNDKNVRPYFSSGSIKSSVFTMIVSIVGAGMLSLPYAMQQSGLLLGSVMFAFSAWASFYSLRILIMSATLTKQYSYGTLAEALLGPKSSTVIRIILILNMWGTVLGYLVAGSSMLHSAIVSLYLMSSEPSAVKASDPVRVSTVMVLFTVFIVTPLSLFRTLGALRYSSVIAVCCAVYLFSFLVYSYFSFCANHYIVHSPVLGNSPNSLMVPDHQVQCFWEHTPQEKFHFDLYHLSPNRVLTTMSILTFAFTCHPSVLPIYAELQRPSEERMLGKVAFRSITAAFLLYITIGIFGYMMFENQLEHSNGNFLLNDFHNDIGSIVGNLLMSTYIVLALPILVNIIRLNSAELIFQAIEYKYRESVTTVDEVTHLTSLSNQGKIPNKSEKTQLGSVPHILLTISVIMITLLPALYISDISDIFGML